MAVDQGLDRPFRDRQGRLLPFGSNFPLGGSPLLLGGEGLKRRMKSREGGTIVLGRQIREGQSDQGLKIREIGQSESGDCMERA